LANLPVADRSFYLPTRAAEIGVTERHLHSAVHRELQERSKRVVAEQREKDRERRLQREQREAEQVEMDRIRKGEARERDRVKQAEQKAKEAEEKEQRRLAKEAEKEAERERREAEKAALQKSKQKAKGFSNISRLSAVQQQSELQKLAERLGEDVAALREEFEQFLGVGSGEVSSEKTEPWPEPVGTAELLEKCSNKIRKHVVLQEHQLVASILWGAHAWTYDYGVPVHSPLLVATSPEPDSGKSTLTGVVCRVCPRFLSNIVEISGPALFRTVDSNKPTIGLTETDDLFQRKSDLRSVVNAGWTRGAKVPRTVSIDGVRVTVYFDCFTPKAIDLLGRNLPPATRSRGIELRMRPKRPDEQVEEFHHVDDPELAVLRRKFARWAADNAAALKEAKPIIPAGLNNRAAANWKLLLAIAELAGGPWPERAREAAERLTRSRRRLSDGVQLLAAFADMFAAGRTEITSADVAAELPKDPTSIWVEYNRGGPVTQRQIAHLLDDYDIHPVSLHPTGRKDFARQGYKVEQFLDAFARYLPAHPIIQSLPTRLKRQSLPTEPKRK
jgi:putative DNA primase/helicase